MTDVDPNCMCGKKHPCPDHGRFVHTPPHRPRMAPDDHLTVEQRRQRDAVHQRISQQDEWSLMKEMAGTDNEDGVDHDEQTGVA